MENSGEGTKMCPYCGEQILVQAIKCRYCQTMLTEVPPVHAAQVLPTSQAESHQGSLVPRITLFERISKKRLAAVVGIAVIVCAVGTFTFKRLTTLELLTESPFGISISSSEPLKQARSVFGEELSKERTSDGTTRYWFKSDWSQTGRLSIVLENENLATENGLMYLSLPDPKRPRTVDEIEQMLGGGWFPEGRYESGGYAMNFTFGVSKPGRSGWTKLPAVTWITSDRDSNIIKEIRWQYMLSAE